MALQRIEAAAACNTKTGAGVRLHPALPQPRGRATLGDTLESWIAELQEKGFEEAALVATTLYDGLVRSNWASVPTDRRIPGNLLESAV